MDSSDVLWAEVDGEGRLVVPAEVVEAYGLAPGAKARIELGKDNLRRSDLILILIRAQLWGFMKQEPGW